ncbi:MAG: NAD(P)/FAD-dependent oxidoreductase [Saprospiraceae bacterium]|nr:NAD(P)/FAD-dependent oxidoreductase [Saprospiraceae bacterium]
MSQRVVIIGGGAAGFFAAITCAESNATCSVVILEQSSDVLSKVRISGGGRCNVTHHCFDPVDLVKYYPRGNKELLGPFHKFNPSNTVTWFEKRSVKLKTESDGRMFPVSDSSESIVGCLRKSAINAGVEIRTRTKVTGISFPSEGNGHYHISTKDEIFEADKLLIAAGSSNLIWEILKNKAYKIISPVPSLFTFNIKDPVTKLMGLSVKNAVLTIQNSKIKTDGPLLITHWGISGPAVLKASAWGAVILHDFDYNFRISIDWIPDYSSDDILDLKLSIPKKQVSSNTQFGLPQRLWQYFTDKSGIPLDKNWASLSKKEIDLLILNLKNGIFNVSGKSTFKDEFVTAGGIDLKQIDFNKFESKLHPGLYFAGEILNIDALTGGFNFQAAWTGGYIAGKAMSGISE